MKSKKLERRALKRLAAAVALVASVPEACARDPDRDFTRTRKIPLYTLLYIMITWAWDTIGIELEDIDGWTGGAPTVSAFCRQRAKLRDDAMPRVHSTFLAMWDQQPLMGRFVLYGVDGTDVQLQPSSDERTRVGSGKGGSEHNEAHPTMVYDIKRRTFQDMVWEGSKEQDEYAAFCRLIDRTPPAFAPDGTRLVPLWLGDRGFLSYNTLCHLFEAGHSFILRATDDMVGKLFGEEDVPEGCFDVTIERMFVRTECLSARSRPDEPEIYKHVKSKTRFDAIARGSRAEYTMTLRIVRRQLPRTDKDRNDSRDRWLNLVTNLPAWEFRAKWLVRTYKRRWRHEVNYNHLKHVVGLENPKTRDLDRAGMEAWGRIILYNCCSLATTRILSKRGRGKKLKRARNLTHAFKGMLRKIRRKVRKRLGRARGKRKMDLEWACSRHTHAVIGGRHYDRRKRNKSPASRGYRH